MTAGTPPLGQLKRVNLTAQVMETVKQYIVDNDLRPGTRLPTERELTANLGISRNVLREALKSLQAIGLIEIRVGDGMFVCDFDYASVMSHISFAVSRTRRELKHFMYAREIIEVGAIDSIVSNITDGDIRNLECILEGYEQAKTFEDNARVELGFHQALLAISGNPVLAEFGRFLGRFFIEVLYFRGKGRTAARQDQHGTLLNALRNRDLEESKRLMRLHVLSWTPWLESDAIDPSYDPRLGKAQLLPPRPIA
jgi:GntR family transcriptional repressor for pyruvate dehydrogenase complex